RALRHVEHLRDRRMREVRLVPEAHEAALLRGERLEGLVHADPPDELVLERFTGRRLLLDVPGSCLAVLLALPQPQRSVPRDLRDPWPGGRGVVATAALAPRPRHGLLRGVV